MSSGCRKIFELLAASLPEAPVIFVNRPNSLLHAILCNQGWPAERIKHALPESLAIGMLTDSPVAGTVVLPAVHTVIASAERRYVREDGQMLTAATLDRLYAPLRQCAAISIGASDDALGILKGGAALIGKCRPAIVAEVAADQAQPILAWLKSYGYITVIDQSSEPSLDRLHDLSPTHILATIADNTQTVTDRIRMFRALRGASSNQFFWTQSLLADAFGQGKEHPLDTVAEYQVYWTGPRRSTRFRLWVPCPGSYRITVRLISDPTIPEPRRFMVGDGQHCDGDILDREGALLYLTRSVEVGARDVAHGLTIALVAKDTVWRTIDGEVRRVGLAIAGIDMSLLH